MNSQTSIVAANFRLAQWTQQIQECQNRPSDMSVKDWCAAHGITKANYYYRMKQVRKACLHAAAVQAPEFIDLACLPPAESSAVSAPEPAALLRSPSGAVLEISAGAPAEFIASLIGALCHAQ